MKKQYLRFQRMLFLTLMFLFTLFSGKALAQSTLSLGDISIIGLNANTPDNFAFVTWVDLLDTTEIRFTDNAFSAASNSSTAGIYRDQEQYVTWRNNTGATIPAGTVIVITAATNPMSTNLGQIVSVLNSSGSAATSMSLINTSGDQIFAFQGAGVVPPGNTTTSTFSGNILFAIGYSGSSVASTGWLTSGTISGSTSYLPSNVTGTSSVFLGPNVAGGQYTGARTGLANFAAYKALIANPANWTTVGGSSVTPAFTTTAFSAGALPVFTGNPPNRTICLGGNTTFSATATNATSYQWQENAGSGFVDITNGGVYSNATTATLTITGATAGMSGYTYRLVATSAGGSATSNAATLTVINITSTGSQTNISCNGGSNGTATVVPAGGIAPYTYSWSPSGGTAATATGLAAGNYTVTITDNLLCQTTRNFTITQPVALGATTSQTNVSCNGGSNGTATVSVTGGTPGYTYSWVWTSGGGAVVGTTATITGRPVGSYTVTVTDANSCSITRNVIIVQPTALNTGTSQTNIACNGGATGALAVTPTGGAGSYTYLWNTGATTSSISGLTAGPYSVTITDANACQTTRNFTIAQPAAALTAATSQTNVSCNGGANGTATVTPTGGTPSYTYSWSPSGGTAATASGLVAGTYTVTITDANACQTTRTVTITQPASAITASTSQTNVSCNGGSNGTATVTPTGGTPGYTYSWSPSGGTAATATGLASGTYTVTITDANACQTTRTVTITQPATAVSGTTVVTNVSCNGGTNGTINLTPTGGTGPYTFNWGGGITTEDRTGLASGTYSVTITDFNGCTGTVNATVTQPATAVSGTTVVTNIACNGGTTGAINLTPTGGTGPYTFNWGGGITTEDRTGLAAGSYSVTITDFNGCTGTVNATVTQPTAITATTAQTNVSCNGGANGTATVTTTGGTPSYTYSWSPSGGTAATASGLVAGTYTVTITDANGCSIPKVVTITQPAAFSITTAQTNVSCNGGTNGTATVTPTGGTGAYTYSWSPTGGTAATATGLASGTYTVTITDANTCQTTRTFTITQPATAVSGTTVVTNIACNGGTTGAINLTPTGGTGPYTFNWGGGITTEDRTGLAAGTYSVTITDFNGCTGTVNATVTQPTAITATTAQTNVSCNGGTNGTASVTVTGGTPGYTYSWSPTGGTAATATGLASGTYTVTITDANTCQTTRTFTITQPTAITATTAQTNVSCNGGSNGTATVTPTGGTGAYTYSWSPTGGTAATASGLASGTYTVTVTDANGCSIPKVVTITQPAALVATAGSQTNVSCNGGSNGTATVNVTGGTPGYTYAWSPSGGTAATASGLASGTYTVTVTDANGCTATQSFTITQPTALVATASSQTNISCNGGTNGSATVSVTGGTGTYTYSWSPSGGTAATATGLASGTYMVTATDANGCTATQSFTITQPAALVASPASQTNVSCNGGTNGSATVSVTGGTGAYTYSWSPTGGTAATASGLASGTYTVTVTDANGCATTQSFTITQPAAFSITTAQTNVSCNGGTNGTATVNVTGGTGAYTYSWSPTGGTAATATGLASGTYTVTITDANTCQTTRTVTITQPTAITATTSQVNIACNGAATGSASVTATGGTGAYTYAWSPSGGTAATATGLTAGNYSVIITDANGCSITKNFTITQAAAINITSQPVAAAVIEGTNATFSVTASNATSYQWQVSTNGTTWTTISNGGTNPVYAGATTNTLTLTGVPLTFNGYLYRAQVASGANCSVNSNAALLTVSPDLNTKDFSRIAVNIYPNPASSQVFIKIPEISNYRNCSLAVYDLNGRVVIQKRLSAESEMIDIANLQQGVYIFNITSDSAKTTKRVVKY